jgi:hypothetical protein
MEALPVAVAERPPDSSGPVNSSPFNDPAISLELKDKVCSFARTNDLSVPEAEDLLSRTASAAFDMGTIYDPNEAFRRALVSYGPALFRWVVRVLRDHYYMERPWNYRIVALWIFQAHLTRQRPDLLPAVFYLFFPGRLGTGKSKVLRLLARLSEGEFLENVSVPALAHTLADGKAVCLDEYDVPRGKEIDEVRDSLVRQGYQAGAAPYRRWDPTRKAFDLVPVFGPKALSFRGSVDAALQSRGFTIESANPTGDGGFALVLANFWPGGGELSARLKEWAQRTVETLSSSELERRAREPAFREVVRSVVRNLGANRESELAAITLQIAEIVGVDLTSELREALTARDVALAGDEADDLADLREVLLDEVRSQARLETGEARVFQKTISGRLARRRAEYGARPLSNRAFAQLRRDLGVRDSMLRNWRGSLVWVLSEEFLSCMQISETNPANSPGLTEETNLNGTRADRARAELAKGGGLGS